MEVIEDVVDDGFAVAIAPVDGAEVWFYCRTKAQSQALAKALKSVDEAHVSKFKAVRGGVAVMS